MHEKLGADINNLLHLAGPPLGPPLQKLPREIDWQADLQTAQLGHLLLRRNGFFVFESALHLFPLAATSAGYDLLSWNSMETWRLAYGDAVQDDLFFAEDIFGEQFAIRDGCIWRFNPETGESEEVAATLEAWASQILADYAAETGYPLAHEWQTQHGPLPPDKRLVPITPFVMGGEFALTNLHALDAVAGMRFRADIARQIRDLPDGSTVHLTVTE